MIAIALLTSHLRVTRSRWVFPASSAVSNSDVALLPVPPAKRIVYSPATPLMVVHFADFATPLSQTQFELAAPASLPAYFCQFRPSPQVPLICNALLYSTAEAGTIPPLDHRTPTHPVLPPSPAAGSPDGFSILQAR